jgi:hypothetical protein
MHAPYFKNAISASQYEDEDAFEDASRYRRTSLAHAHLPILIEGFSQYACTLLPLDDA